MKSLKLRRDTDQSILSEVRKAGIAQNDFFDIIPARKPDANASIAHVTKEIHHLNKPLLYIDPKGPFVDSSLFSDLKTISVAKLSLQRYAIIGTTHQNIRWDILVPFLILSDVICTYIHVGSQMEIVFPSEHRAEVRGSHTYFTNEEHIEPFAFSIEQDHTQTIHCLDLSS